MRPVVAPTEDVDMLAPDDNQDLGIPDIPDLSFVVSHDDVAMLRGGSQQQGPPAQPESEEETGDDEGDDDEGDEDEGGEDEGDDELGVDDGFNPNYFDFHEASSDSDWSNYNLVPQIALEHELVIAGLEGSQLWNEEQRKVHRLLYLRGFQPMIPSAWRMDFLMWGVAQPEMDEVFTPLTRRKKHVLISACGNELTATKALESLFYLTQTVKDYAKLGESEKITSYIVKTIRAYNKWAMKDTGVDLKDALPILAVKGYELDFNGGDVDGDVDSGWGTPSEDDEDDDEEEGEEEGDDDLVHAMSRDMERTLKRMGSRWRHLLRSEGQTGQTRFAIQPPTLYLFGVHQHTILLTSFDPSVRRSRVIVLETMRVRERGDWLWNALSIAIPVNIARQSLLRFREYGYFGPTPPEEEPDL
ncbi:hypothetical protein B0H63DRAFT_129367 [Podospora didyma]|uniref:Uncharacterized protein n=1 Tax=Podospora didyma TaxID=330526 RepID=A0AAE0P0F8_9PEZI|nr:hypothetical protein B0H63DRAFT_129367 [Podospora didyma]